MTRKKEFGLWSVRFDPEDGGRITALSWNGTELLTTRSDDIRLPEGDYGKYETRFAYGYDDCFPTVDPTVYPGLSWKIPDHGELCWLGWNVASRENGLRFDVDSAVLPLRFTREMIFEPTRLIWKFKTENSGNAVLPFQHVMHALLPLENIKSVGLPEFETVRDEIENKVLEMKSAQEVQDYLLSTPAGTHHMLFLLGVKEGTVQWEYADGVSVGMIFDREIFTSLGIWWDNHSYPDEDHCRRTECAFEPTPGNSSDLARAHKEGLCQFVEPGRSVEWKVEWKITNNQ